MRPYLGGAVSMVLVLIAAATDHPYFTATWAQVIAVLILAVVLAACTIAIALSENHEDQ